MTALESGDRAAFLSRLRAKLDRAARHDLAHPLPPPVESVPVAHSTLLDADDVLGSFLRNARAVAAAAHDVAGDVVPDELLDALVERSDVRRAVTSAEPDAVAIGQRLAARGVDVAPLSIDAAADADLGVTSCVAAIATTGTVVVSSTAAGGRGASLLPPVHLCLVPASRVAATSADVLRPLGASGALPANLVLITGPSRSGDIEQIIALGVHGPVAVDLVLLRGA